MLRICITFIQKSLFRVSQWDSVVILRWKRCWNGVIPCFCTCRQSSKRSSTISSICWYLWWQGITEYKYCDCGVGGFGFYTGARIPEFGWNVFKEFRIQIGSEYVHDKGWRRGFGHLRNNPTTFADQTSILCEREVLLCTLLSYPSSRSCLKESMESIIYRNQWHLHVYFVNYISNKRHNYK